MLAIEEIKGLTVQKLPPLTVVTGDDVGQYEVIKSTFLSVIGYEASDLNYAYYDMREVDYQTLEMELVSLPFFADEKIVLLDYFVDVTTDRKNNLDDKALKQFEAYLEQPVETTKLVIFASGKLDRKRRLVKLLKRDGKVFEATPLKENDLRQYFISVIKEKNLTMTAQVLEQLLIKSNFDFSEMTKNLDFLATYKPGAEISLKDVAIAIPKTLQDNIFDLTQLILQRKIDVARSLVRDLTLQGEDEVKLVAVMLSQFRTFLQVKILQGQGKNEAQIVADLSELLGKKVSPYQVKYALRDTRDLSVNFLKAANRALIQCDFQIKKGVYDKAYLFDLLLLKLAA